jgi:hypothetical protein
MNYNQRGERRPDLSPGFPKIKYTAGPDMHLNRIDESGEEKFLLSVSGEKARSCPASLSIY